MAESLAHVFEYENKQFHEFMADLSVLHLCRDSWCHGLLACSMLHALLLRVQVHAVSKFMLELSVVLIAGGPRTMVNLRLANMHMHHDVSLPALAPQLVSTRSSVTIAMYLTDICQLMTRSVPLSSPFSSDSAPSRLHVF